jgi:hypothetical protein
MVHFVLNSQLYLLLVSDLFYSYSVHLSKETQTNSNRNMKKLEKYTEVNGQNYKLIKRTAKVALYSVNDGRRYEVTRIYIPKIL